LHPRTPSVQCGCASPRRDRPGCVPRSTGPSMASGTKRRILQWAVTGRAAERPAPVCGVSAKRGPHPAACGATAVRCRLQPYGRPQQRHLRSPLPQPRASKGGWPLSGSPAGRSVRGFRRATGGSSNAYERPCCGFLASDCSPVGVVAVLSPAGTMHQVHRRNASLQVVPDWLVRVVPQVPGNRMAGAPRGGGPARARLGHRPSRKAAAARRTRGRNGPRASAASLSPLTPSGRSGSLPGGPMPPTVGVQPARPRVCSRHGGVPESFAAAHPGRAAVGSWCLRVMLAGRRLSALAGAGGGADEPD
jgi:hypothetical protein